MRVSHRTGSYEVRFVDLHEALSTLPAPAFVITDETVYGLYAELLPPGPKLLRVAPGEGSKTPSIYLDAIEWLSEAGAQRDAVVVALGGGVIGDLAGFVAATYMRGVSLLQIPTTLLAQVDSSVGGKVGVDLREGKNMLGAFHPPIEVRVAVEALETLPPRQFSNGMAEVLKYGFIMAPELLDMNPKTERKRLVTTCIDCKRAVVEADEFETTGRRAILNFGHTVGHALEVLTRYEELLHGEAISIGMCAEASLSEGIGIAEPGTRRAVEGALKAQGLPVSHPLLAQPGPMLAAMRRDKKSSGNKLAFSLLRGIGSCELVRDVPDAEVEAAFSRM